MLLKRANHNVPLAVILTVIGMLVCVPVPPLGITLIIGGLGLLLMPMPRLDLGKLFFQQKNPTDYPRRGTAAPQGLRYYVSADDYWIAEIANDHTLILYRNGEAAPWTSTTLAEIDDELQKLSRSVRITPQRELHMQMLVNCKALLLDYQEGRL